MTIEFIESIENIKCSFCSEKALYLWYRREWLSVTKLRFLCEKHRLFLKEKELIK